MSRAPASATFTSEFGHELETERLAWLRRRYLWYLGFGLLISVPSLAYHLFGNQRANLGTLAWSANGVLMTLSVLVTGLLFAYVLRTPRPRVPIGTMAYWQLVIMGSLVLLVQPIIMSGAMDHAREVITAKGERQTQVRAPGMTFQFDPNDSEKPSTLNIGIAPDTTKPAPPPAPNAEDDEDSTPASAATGDEDRRRKQRDKQLALFNDPELAARTRMGIQTGSALWAIFISHFMACVFLPWKPREALRPAIPLIGLNFVMTLGYTGWVATRGTLTWWGVAIAGGALVASLLVPLPGMIVCAWRHSRFRRRKTYDILRGRYSELKQELTSARQIHEGLFPGPITSGPVRFDYSYEPMRQIGGDYLHLFHVPASTTDQGGSPKPPRYAFVLMDVTGHGIPAALTVNRLHGELTRIFAEHPDMQPGEVLCLLNKYTHLTLSNHSVYVTAMCISVDPRTETLTYASGGHPPAFLRDAAGRVHEMESTTFVLGACPPEHFHADPKTIPFHPGDTVIAYTDGATEARDEHGRYFGINGIQKIVACENPDPDGGWPTTIRRAVEKYRFGPTADDILVIEIRRPVTLNGLVEGQPA